MKNEDDLNEELYEVRDPGRRKFTVVSEDTSTVWSLSIRDF